MHKLIFILAICYSALGYSQSLSFQEVNSTTASLYQKQKWYELIEYGKKASEADFYYFNIRMGVALFETKQHFEAEQFLVKAIKQYNNDFPKKVLYWNYILLGEDRRAEETYQSVSAEEQKQLSYKESTFQYLDAETGLRLSNHEEIPNSFYGLIGFQTRLGKSMRVSHSGIFFYQKNDTRLFDHKQYNIRLKKYWKTYEFEFGVFHALASYNLKKDTVTYSFLEEGLFTSYGGSVKISKRFNRLRASGELTFISHHNDADQTLRFQSFLPPPEFIIQETSIKNSNQSIIPSIKVSYTLPVAKDRFTLGIRSSFISDTTGSHFNFRPFATVGVSKKIWLNFDYLKTGDYLFLDHNTRVVYGNFKTSKLTSSLYYAFSEKWIGRIVYSNENANDVITNQEVTINSIYLGINFKLNRK